MNKKNRSIHPAAAWLLALPLLWGAALPAAQAQVNVDIGISLPGVNIGVNLPAYPQLVRVPGYPVYYAPSARTNYFFYDGLYWVYADDDWYSSDWYNGPWLLVEPAYVPVYVLRVPVRYYRRPPVYFRSWRGDAPPRWGDHWGRDWEDRRRGWDRWDRRAAPAPAPLPLYQRNYTGNRYPRAPEQQRELRAANYRYQPREAVSREQFRRPVAPSPGIAMPSRDGRPDRAERDVRSDRTDRGDRADRRSDRPDRAVPPPPREVQRPQVSDGSQARPQVQPPRQQVPPERPRMERPEGPSERPQGRPERMRDQSQPPPPSQARPPAERVQPPPRAQQPERAQAPEQRSQPERGQPRAQSEQRGPQGGGPGREANPGNRGGDDAKQDRGRGGPPEGRGRDKEK